MTQDQDQEHKVLDALTIALVAGFVLVVVIGIGAWAIGAHQRDQDIHRQSNDMFRDYLDANQ